MNLKSPQLWIAFFSLTAIFTMALVDIERTSPGALAAVHLRDPDLAGANDCDACHGGWGQSMAQACLDCHEPIDDQIEDADGLHGMLPGAEVQACARCHADHHGEGFAMVNDRSFELAGVPDPDAFDHELIGFRMAGKHLELECAKCHRESNQAILPEGKPRFLGLTQDCATCHEDPHKGEMGASCAQCHGQSSFDELAFYDHDRVLPLVGGHAEISCRKCHGESTPHSLENVADDSGVAARTCVKCHDSPHAQPFVDVAAQLANRSSGSSCVVCHEAEHTSFRESPATTVEQHAATGFPLTAPHAESECSACHAPGDDDFDARYPGRRADDCARCHEDPHAGQFSADGQDARACIECHDLHRFEPHAFDLARHEATAMPLTGAHVETDCDACHDQHLAEGARVFRGTSTACSGCHADAHRGFFKARAEDCGTCHLTTDFSGMSSEGFDHERWTEFAVVGAHAQSDCESCHPRADAPDPNGRTLGFVADHFGAFGDCSTCHANPHGDTFEAPGLPNQISGRTSCGRCHVETSFRSFPDGFDHGRWTGWDLSGAHGRVECSACHTPQRPDAAGRTWRAAPGRDCADCHEDVHAGQFRRSGHTDCARCHGSTLTFYDLTFDHDLDSRFPLDAGHVVQPCSACHEPWPLPGGGTTIRYRPLDTDCAACHGVSEEQMRKRAGGPR